MAVAIEWTPMMFFRGRIVVCVVVLVAFGQAGKSFAADVRASLPEELLNLMGDPNLDSPSPTIERFLGRAAGKLRGERRDRWKIIRPIGDASLLAPYLVDDESELRLFPALVARTTTGDLLRTSYEFYLPQKIAAEKVGSVLGVLPDSAPQPFIQYFLDKNLADAPLQFGRFGTIANSPRIHLNGSLIANFIKDQGKIAIELPQLLPSTATRTFLKIFADGSRSLGTFHPGMLRAIDWGWILVGKPLLAGSWMGFWGENMLPIEFGMHQQVYDNVLLAQAQTSIFDPIGRGADPQQSYPINLGGDSPEIPTSEKRFWELEHGFEVHVSFWNTLENLTGIQHRVLRSDRVNQTLWIRLQDVQKLTGQTSQLLRLRKFERPRTTTTEPDNTFDNALFGSISTFNAMPDLVQIVREHQRDVDSFGTAGTATHREVTFRPENLKRDVTATVGIQAAVRARLVSGLVRETWRTAPVRRGRLAE